MHSTPVQWDHPRAGKTGAEAPPTLAEPRPDLAVLYAQRPVQKRWLERQRARISMALLVPLVVLSAFSVPRIAAHSWAGVALSALACLLFMAGAICRLWAMLYIGGRKGRMIVSEGPYSLVRNPLYWGTFLITLSLAVSLGNLTLLLGCLAASSLYALVTVPSEERRLASKHGDAYRDYCRRVPRFLPKTTRVATCDWFEVDIACLAIEARRAAVWMWIPVAARVLTILRLQSWWPHWFWLP